MIIPVTFTKVSKMKTLLKKFILWIKKLFSAQLPKNKKRHDDRKDPEPTAEPPKIITPDVIGVPEIGVDKPLLWYPNAYHKSDTFTRKKYLRGGRPSGMVVHYPVSMSVKGTIRVLKRKKLGVHIIIDREGRVWQLAPFNIHLAHAGSSSWNGSEGRTLNDEYLGVEVLGWGKLTKKGKDLYTEYGRKIDPEDIRYSGDNSNIDRGYYHKFTRAQEEALLLFSEWAVKNFKFPFKSICGHDECKKGKVDPGACLSVTMPEFRNIIASKL